IETYRTLELVQRGRYAAAASLAAAWEGHAVARDDAVLRCATVLRELRAGSTSRANAVLHSTPPMGWFKDDALMTLARLEASSTLPADEAVELARTSYQTMVDRPHARAAGVAAVALVRAGGPAPPSPPWLGSDSPLLVYWDWAAGLGRHDVTALRAV